MVCHSAESGQSCRSASRQSVRALSRLDVCGHAAGKPGQFEWQRTRRICGSTLHYSGIKRGRVGTFKAVHRIPESHSHWTFVILPDATSTSKGPKCPMVDFLPLSDTL